MPFHVSVGSCKKPITQGEDFPIKLAKGVVAKLIVNPDQQDEVRVVILDVGKVEVLSGLGFQISAKIDVTMSGDFIIRHISSGRLAVVIFLP